MSVYTLFLPTNYSPGCVFRRMITSYSLDHPNLHTVHSLHQTNSLRADDRHIKRQRRRIRSGGLFISRYHGEISSVLSLSLIVKGSGKKKSGRLGLVMKS